LNTNLEETTTIAAAAGDVKTVIEKNTKKINEQEQSKVLKKEQNIEVSLFSRKFNVKLLFFMFL
jgi:hypothetical protein